MAITKTVVYDQTSIVGDYKHVHCREATIVREDGVEISRTFHRHVLTPSNCVKNEDDSFTHTDTDISGEPAETQAVCTDVWSDAVKAAWKTYTEENQVE